MDSPSIDWNILLFSIIFFLALLLFCMLFNKKNNNNKQHHQTAIADKLWKKKKENCYWFWLFLFSPFVSRLFCFDFEIIKKNTSKEKKIKMCGVKKETRQRQTASGNTMNGEHIEFEQSEERKTRSDFYHRILFSKNIWKRSFMYRLFDTFIHCQFGKKEDKKNDDFDFNKKRDKIMEKTLPPSTYIHICISYSFVSKHWIKNLFVRSDQHTKNTKRTKRRKNRKKKLKEKWKHSQAVCAARFFCTWPNHFINGKMQETLKITDFVRPSIFKTKRKPTHSIWMAVYDRSIHPSIHPALSIQNNT